MDIVDAHAEALPAEDKDRLGKFDINFYALRKDGVYGSASLWNGATRRGELRPRQFTLNDGGKSRLENCAYLLERKRSEP